MSNPLPDWTGQTAVVIASGPSLTAQDVAYASDRARCVCVNDNWIKVRQPEVVYASDLEWWRYYADAMRHLRQLWPDVALVTGCPTATSEFDLTLIRGHQGAGIDSRPGHLKWNNNSGMAAINVAYHCGARRILLLGLDCELGPQGQKHWFGDHPGRLNKNSPLKGFAKQAHQIQKDADKLGVEIINCSRRTAITAFRRALITEVL